MHKRAERQRQIALVVGKPAKITSRRAFITGSVVVVNAIRLRRGSLRLSSDPVIAANSDTQASAEDGTSASSSLGDPRCTGARDKASAIKFFFSWNPARRKRVALHFQPEAQDSWVVQFVQTVLVENRDEWSVIGEEEKRR